MAKKKENTFIVALTGKNKVHKITNNWDQFVTQTYLTQYKAGSHRDPTREWHQQVGKVCITLVSAGTATK